MKHLEKNKVRQCGVNFIKNGKKSVDFLHHQRGTGYRQNDVQKGFHHGDDQRDYDLLVRFLDRRDLRKRNNT